MNNPLHASYYADNAIHETVEIVDNLQIARDTYRARFECPTMAARITPGQFVMVRLAHLDDPLLGRPLALYDVSLDDNGVPCWIDVVYLVGGKMTKRFATLQPGNQLDVWGPLGNGFQPVETEHLVMVAGGIGQTPFLALAKERLGLQRYGNLAARRRARVTFCYGARTESYLAGVEDFEKVGMDVRISTDDGSRGHHGLVTDLLSSVIEESDTNPKIVCCGPEPMMEAVAKLAAAKNVPCQVSLETPMACGVGICFTCVAKVRDETGEWDYARTCVEGPVFDADRIVWD